MINISKALIVFVPSLILGILPQTLCVFIGFNAIRITSFGLHALTSIGCSVCSITMFTVIPYLLKDIQVPSYIVAGVGAAALLAIFKYSPADTKARPIIGIKKRKRLKKISLVTCVVLFSALTALPYGGIKAMVILGAFYEIIFILPITYKILRREVRNYEKYERKLS